MACRSSIPGTPTRSTTTGWAARITSPPTGEAAEQAIAANPGIKTDVRANRAFLARVVRYLADECGVRQFLDIGTGLPVAGNTHQVAQEVEPGVVQPQQWRPEPETLSPPQVTAWCGVARKR